MTRLAPLFVDKSDDIPLTDLEVGGRSSEEDAAAPLIENTAMQQGRRIFLGNHPEPKAFCSNFASNSKYNFATFLPVCLYNQIFPPLRIGYLSAYILPLLFVLSITLGKEALDDIARRRRDKDANSTYYDRLGLHEVQAKDITVGDILFLHKNMRIPADCVLLKTDDSEAFIRTDQLDGETDWKLRSPCTITQVLATEELLSGKVFIDCPEPQRDLNCFNGSATIDNNTVALTIDNTLWTNTVLASKSAICVVVYTGRETRQALNSTEPRNKTGILEEEINMISKILCLLTLTLSLTLVFHSGLQKNWWVSLIRFMILFSTIIPVSLRVNLDLGKLRYSSDMTNDKNMPDIMVRSTTIPEDLGRIEYLLSDKTGTLTMNEMEMKKLHIGSIMFTNDDLQEIRSYFNEQQTASSRRSIGQKTKDMIYALSICHNVTPINEESDKSSDIVYQASSPDEVAIVEWTKKVGLQLTFRDKRELHLMHGGTIERVEILHIFPFTSESKRMSIIVRFSGEIWFFQKGADTVMTKFVQKTDWLEEECGNLARDGLRTLVIARKKLSLHEYENYAEEMLKASVQLHSRDVAISRVVSNYMEHDLEVLGITGVEDRLQTDVKASLELLKNANIKIWMLTGDKMETAKCIAISSRLFHRNQPVCTIENEDPEMSWRKYYSVPPHTSLMIDGNSLQQLVDMDPKRFSEKARDIPAIVACRCTPKQKANIADILKKHSKKRVCCIGDGGNDVSMIQAADIGIGITGKEGMQASLAADYSIPQFCYLPRLLLWHGRNSYRNSCKLVHLIIHRGLLIAICQFVFSIASHSAPIALYQGWLMVGYATVYTMMPIFSLVLDRDVTEDIAFLYPELYRELAKGNQLSLLTFALYVLLSLYQGTAISLLTMLLVGVANIKRAVCVSFAALILTELSLVASVVTKWNSIIAVTEIVSIIIFVLSVPFLGDYYDLKYMTEKSFYWKTAVVSAASVVPPWAIKFANRMLNPPNYAKLQF